MASAELKLVMDIVPGNETIATCLHLLNLWQWANMDKMVALVPDKVDKERYVYEIIDIKKDQ